MKVRNRSCKVPVKAVVDAAVKALYTGHIGDGKIFIYDVEDVVKEQAKQATTLCRILNNPQ